MNRRGREGGGKRGGKEVEVKECDSFPETLLKVSALARERGIGFEPSSRGVLLKQKQRSWLPESGKKQVAHTPVNAHVCWDGPEDQMQSLLQVRKHGEQSHLLGRASGRWDMLADHRQHPGRV